MWESHLMTFIPMLLIIVSLLLTTKELKFSYKDGRRTEEIVRTRISLGLWIGIVFCLFVPILNIGAFVALMIVIVGSLYEGSIFFTLKHRYFLKNFIDNIKELLKKDI